MYSNELLILNTRFTIRELDEDEQYTLYHRFHMRRMEIFLFLRKDIRCTLP